MADILSRSNPAFLSPTALWQALGQAYAQMNGPQGGAAPGAAMPTQLPLPAPDPLGLNLYPTSLFPTHAGTAPMPAPVPAPTATTSRSASAQGWPAPTAIPPVQAPQTLDLNAVLQLARDAMGQQNLQAILGQRQQMSVSDILGVSDPMQLLGLTPEQGMALVNTRADLATKRTQQAAEEAKLANEVSGRAANVQLLQNILPQHFAQQASMAQEKFQQESQNARLTAELSSQFKLKAAEAAQLKELSPTQMEAMLKLKARMKDLSGEKLTPGERRLLGTDKSMSVDDARALIETASLLGPDTQMGKVLSTFLPLAQQVMQDAEASVGLSPIAPAAATTTAVKRYNPVTRKLE